MSIKSKFLIVLMAAFSFGFGACMQATGIKAGVPLVAVCIIWGVSFVGWIVVAFTVLPDIKEVLYPESKESEKP